MVNEQFLKQFKSEYPNVRLIGVTKYVGPEGVVSFRDSGITDIGENRVEQILTKQEVVTEGVTWHLIGQLQSKKVKKIINQIDYLHSLDRVSLADEIEKRALEPVKCLIEVKTTSDNKSGLALDEVDPFIEQMKEYTKIKIVGFMTMAEDSDDEEVVRASFKKLKALKDKYGYPELSMGMSNDYKIAIEEGATMVRLGRILYKEGVL